MTGTRVVVTAGHRGLGLVTTRALAAAGAHVTVATRHPALAARTLAGVDRVAVAGLDLLDPASIDAFTRAWDGPLHVLVNAANLPAPAQVERDARGVEKQFATGHLGHFQLTTGLLPALRAAGAARVVTLSSGAHRFGRIRWEDPGFTTGYHPQAAYAQTKLANVLFSVGLDRRYAADGVRGYAVHPGVVLMGALDDPVWAATLREQGLLDAGGRPVIDPARGKKTPEQGAATVVFAATSPLLADVGGVYLKDNDVAPVDDEVRELTADVIPSDATSAALDPATAQRLWGFSERLVG
nr:SDR family NAD(P)-dependent oxidoreductase [Kineococcus aurantiacus]